MFSQLAPGARVGRFRIEGMVGSGAMGVVHVALDEHLNRRVALKVMSAHLADDPSFRQRFAREAEVLGQLDSPHIVKVYDHGEFEGHLWIATQLVEGGDLAELLARFGPLPTGLALRVCTQVASGLEAAHARGIVHRDVKPENILLAHAGTAEPHAYLTDFGLARQSGADLTTVRSTTGTWDYLAPECGSGQPATPASDIYAVGGLLFTCLTGRPPYEGSPVEVALAHARQAAPQLPADPGRSRDTTRRLDALIARAMNKDPGQRHQSAAVLADDLSPLLASPTRTPRRARRLGLAAAACIALIAAAGIVFAANTGRDDDTTPSEPGSSEAGSSSATSPTAQEPVDRPVTGDFDSDGYGDLALSMPGKDHGDDVVLLRSTDGTALGDPKLWATDVGEALLGDVDGDGTDELVSVGSSSTSSKWRIAVVRDGEDEVPQFDLKAPQGSGALYSALGDFDGDGKDDLALVSDGSLPDAEGIWVSLSTGESFGAFKRWFSFKDTDDHDGIQRPIPGDFDGDGDDDVAFQTAGSILEFLESDGSSLTGVGEPTRTSLGSVSAAGDFDGDGTDEVVGTPKGATDSALVLWNWSDGEWQDTVALELGEDTYVDRFVAPAVVDLNGDRRDDVLLMTGEYDAPTVTLDVTLSNGLGFDPLTSWRTLSNSTYDLALPVGGAGPE